MLPSLGHSAHRWGALHDTLKSQASFFRDQNGTQPGNVKMCWDQGQFRESSLCLLLLKTNSRYLNFMQLGSGRGGKCAGLTLSRPGLLLHLPVVAGTLQKELNLLEAGLVTSSIDNPRSL